MAQARPPSGTVSCFTQKHRSQVPDPDRTSHTHAPAKAAAAMLPFTLPAFGELALGLSVERGQTQISNRRLALASHSPNKHSTLAALLAPLDYGRCFLNKPPCKADCAPKCRTLPTILLGKETA